MKTKSQVLVSFVGTNDAGKLIGKDDGAILTALKALKKIEKVHLLWSPSDNFKVIANYLKKEIKQRKLSNYVISHPFDLDDVTDHNEIYPKLLEFCKDNFTADEDVTAAIASGTPAMQVCWILMAESGDFNVKLIRSNETKYGKPPITEIKLGTGLPKVIKRLEEENINLKNLLPIVTMNLSRGELKIGDKTVKLSPTQFAYYRYFLERAKEEKEYERFGGIETSQLFLKKIIEYHKISFPDSELFIQESEKILRNGNGADMRTFRGHISKINKKISLHLNDTKISHYYEIETEGMRHSTRYGVNLSPEKIII